LISHLATGTDSRASVTAFSSFCPRLVLDGHRGNHPGDLYDRERRRWRVPHNQAAPLEVFHRHCQRRDAGAVDEVESGHVSGDVGRPAGQAGGDPLPELGGWAAFDRSISPERANVARERLRLVTLTIPMDLD